MSSLQILGIIGVIRRTFIAKELERFLRPFCADSMQSIQSKKVKEASVPVMASHDAGGH
jgi:hypothetical protein